MTSKTNMTILEPLHNAQGQYMDLVYMNLNTLILLAILAAGMNEFNQELSMMVA